MNQLLDVIDHDENIIDQAPRDVVHRDGLLHREIGVWLTTAHQKIVFQRRASTKKVFPDRLDTSVGGHIEQGQDPITAALAELHEETGIQAQADDLQFISKRLFDDGFINGGLLNRHIKYLYRYKHPVMVADLIVEEGAGAGFEAYSVTEILNFAKTNPDKFTPSAVSPEQLEMYPDLVLQVDHSA